MEEMAAAQGRSVTYGGDAETGFHSQLGEELNHLISVPPESNTSSFTALLGLPANQAMELLVQAPIESPVTTAEASLLASLAVPRHTISPPSLPPPPIFRTETTLNNMDWVKQEPEDSDSDPNSPALSNDQSPKPTTKRKEREKKGKESIKKSKKTANENTVEGGEKLPYVHVRARRGQATDSHSLAERARREKINARMKLLQELVPGCNKISGTAMVLDEIINHVQSLQRQVEFLSMRLASVNPRIDFNLDTLMAAESGSTADSNYQSMAAAAAMPPPVWVEGHMQANRQEFQQQWYLNGLDHQHHHQQHNQHPVVWNREEDNSIFITQDNSLLSFDSSGNNAVVPLHSNQLKTEM